MGRGEVADNRLNAGPPLPTDPLDLGRSPHDNHLTAYNRTENDEKDTKPGNNSLHEDVFRKDREGFSLAEESRRLTEEVDLILKCMNPTAPVPTSDTIGKPRATPRGPAAPGKRRSTMQLEQLERAFLHCPTPSEEDRRKLAGVLGMEEKQVQTWFQNKRARLKTKNIQQDYDSLRQQNNSYRHALEQAKRTNDDLHQQLSDLQEAFQKKQADMEDLRQAAQALLEYYNSRYDGTVRLPGQNGGLHPLPNSPLPPELKLPGELTNRQNPIVSNSQQLPAISPNQPLPKIVSPVSQPITIPINPFAAPAGNPIAAPAGNPIAAPSGNPITAPAGNPIAAPAGNPIAAPRPHGVLFPPSPPNPSPLSPGTLDPFNRQNVFPIAPPPSRIEPKSPAVRSRIIAAAKQCNLLSTFDDSQLGQIADAMTEKKVTSGEIVVVEGEYGTKFFLIEKGEFEAHVKGKSIRKYPGKGAFGELALILNQPRAATVVANSDGTLWALDRSSFQDIVLKGNYENDDTCSSQGSLVWS